MDLRKFGFTVASAPGKKKTEAERKEMKEYKTKRERNVKEISRHPDLKNSCLTYAMPVSETEEESDNNVMFC